MRSATATCTRDAASAFPCRRRTISIISSGMLNARALRANLVERAERWRWSSLGREQSKIEEAAFPILSDWPLPRPTDWGCKSSISHRAKRNWRQSAGASTAGVPTATAIGLAEPPGAWAWNRPFAHEAVQERKASHASYRRLPIFGGQHLFQPHKETGSPVAGEPVWLGCVVVCCARLSACDAGGGPSTRRKPASSSSPARALGKARKSSP